MKVFILANGKALHYGDQIKNVPCRIVNVYA